MLVTKKGSGEGENDIDALFTRVAQLAGPGTQAKNQLSLRAWLELAERWRILQELKRAGGNRSQAARSLGIGRRTLYHKIEKLELQPDIYSVDTFD